VYLRKCRYPVVSVEQAGIGVNMHTGYFQNSRCCLFATVIGLALYSLSAMAGLDDVIETADGPGTDAPAIPAGWEKLEDATVGFSLFHPPDWVVEERVVSTQFADGARCRSVRFIDFEPPADSGAAAPMQQSFVQVCAKPKVQTGSLDQYMRRVYGDSFDRTFALVQLNGTRAFQAKDTGSSRTVFAESRSDLVQIITAIATSPGKFSERQLQVQQILGSLQLK
jgi:hypothetical protein